MLSTIGVNKKSPLMWSPLCYKSSLLMFIRFFGRGATLSFSNPQVSRNFYVLPNIIIEQFLSQPRLVTPLWLEHSIPNRNTCVDFVELDMVNYDVILGMHWLHAYFASIDCRIRVVKFHFLMNTSMSEMVLLNF